MIAEFAQIKAAVLALPPEARAEIVGAVMESLLASTSLSDAWKAELDRREAEYEQGKVDLIDNDEVFAQVRARLQRGASPPPVGPLSEAD